MVAVSEGYPDWQRVQSRALAPLVVETFDTLGVTTDKGPYFVGNFPVLLVKIVGGASTKYNVQFVWYSDAAMTTQLFLKLVAVEPNIPLYVAPIRVLSPYLKVTFFPTGYVSGDEVTLYVTPSYTPMAASEINDPILIQENGHLTAAGATDNIYFLQVMEGPMVFHWRVPGSTIWSLSVQSMNDVFTYTTNYFVDNQAGGIEGFDTITLPPRPSRVAFHNGDAATRGFNCTIGSMVF